MNPTLQSWLMAGQMATMIAGIIMGWGRISASFATVRADIKSLSRRIDRYVEHTDLQLNRHADLITENAEAVHRLEGWKDALE